MDHLSIPRTQRSQGMGRLEILMIVALVGAGLFLFKVSLSHHKGASVQAASTVNVGNTNAQYYPLRVRSGPLNTLMPNKKYPALVKVVVDGKLDLVERKNPRVVDVILRKMRVGKHTVVLAMWDNHYKLTQNRYLVQVAPMANDHMSEFVIH